MHNPIIYLEGKMRRLAVCSAVLLLGLSVAYAQKLNIEKRSLLGPATVANSAATNNQAASRDLVIAAAGAGIKNCLTSLDLTAAGTGVLRVLDGGTTTYLVTVQSNGSLIRDWDEQDAFCGSNNTSMTVSFTTSTAGAYNFNYKGYTY